MGSHLRKKTMTATTIDRALESNKLYSQGQALHNSAHPGEQPIPPAKQLAVVTCMDARIDATDLLGLETGDAHIIRNAGGIVTEDAIRSIIISHHLLNTNEVAIIKHTRCGMLAFTDNILKTGLEGNPEIENIISQVTGREFVSPKATSPTPAQFFAFDGDIEPLDSQPNNANTQRLQAEVRKDIAKVVNHPWIPTTGSDAITVRGFIYDVNTGKLEEVSYPD